MTAADVLWGIMGIALVIYALTGGADFGAGFWDLVARGPRAKAQRTALANAIAPIWEANHVWLIFVIVVMFSVFPKGFAAISIAFHIPITLALVGIVLRGAAFTFRAYGTSEPEFLSRWRQVFGWSSALTPVALGSVVAGLSSGHVGWSDSNITTGYFAGWPTLLGLAIGVFVLALFALLAAAYMAVETDGELRNDFVRRAFAAELAAGVLSLVCVALIWAEAPTLWGRLADSGWFGMAFVVTAVAALVVLVSLRQQRVRLARAAAAAQVTSVVLAWGALLNGDILLGALPYHHAGIEPATATAVLWATLAGAAVLFPSLWLLFRIFKGAKAA